MCGRVTQRRESEALTKYYDAKIDAYARSAMVQGDRLAPASQLATLVHDGQNRRLIAAHWGIKHRGCDLENALSSMPGARAPRPSRRSPKRLRRVAQSSHATGGPSIRRTGDERTSFANRSDAHPLSLAALWWEAIGDARP